jgi:hypothetical protein
MTRMNKWLPSDGSNFNAEPGRDQDYSTTRRPSFGMYWARPNQTPLADLINAIVAFLVLIAAGIWLIVTLPLGSIGADCILGFVCAAAVFTTIWCLIRSIRRWRWRMHNTDLTGGVYLRAWQRTPDGLREGYTKADLLRAQP